MKKHLVKLSLIITAAALALPLAARADKNSPDNQLQPILTDSPAKSPREIAQTREVILDPTRENDLPGSKFNQSQAFQFHNEEEVKARLRYEAMTRRLDRIGRYRDW